MKVVWQIDLRDGRRYEILYYGKGNEWSFIENKQLEIWLRVTENMKEENRVGSHMGQSTR